MKTHVLWKFHRRLAFIAGLAVVVWAASGLLHPIMNFTSARPATFMPPALSGAVQGIQPLASLSDMAGVTGVRLVEVDGTPAYQLSLSATEARRYLDAATGAEILNADRQRALALATHYTGRTDIVDATLITEFSLAYPPVNVFLPAWAVRFEGDDGFTAVVETGRDTLVRLTNDTRQVLLTAFQVLHTLPFLPEIIRVPLMTILVGSIMAMAIVGMWLLLKWKGRRPGIYRWHRALAWVVMLPMLAYPVSGLFHLWVYAGKEPRGTDTPLPLPLAEITKTPTSLNSYLVRVGEVSAWRTSEGDWYSTETMSDENAARIMAAMPDAPATLVTNFTDEYGFANRILPVWRLQADDTVTFVDVTGGRVVTTVSALDKAELWSFNELHKWRFLRTAFGGDFKAAAIRDAIQVLITGLIVVLAGIGLWQRIRKPV